MSTQHPQEQGKTQRGTLSVPRLVTEGKMEKKPQNQEQQRLNNGAKLGWVSQCSQLLGTNANCNGSFLCLSQHKSQSLR